MKKNTIILAIFLVIVCVFLLSCKREHHAFPYELRSYFPYEENQELTFVNDSNQTVEARVLKVETTEEYNMPYGCKCPDWDTQRSFTFESDNLSFYGLMSTEYYSRLDISCKCEIHGEASNFYTKFFEGDPFSGNFSSIIGDTIVMENNGDKLIIIKGKGITEFKAGDIVWRLKK